MQEDTAKVQIWLEYAYYINLVTVPAEKMHWILLDKK